MVQNQPLWEALSRDHHLKLKEAIRRLRPERNGILLISQLPPEVLAKIFQFVADDESRESKPLNVSHHWREVASSTPILWRVIPLAFPDCSTAMLERSMTNLVLYAGPGLKSTPIIQLALSHMVRVCDHHIYVLQRISNS